MNREDLDACTNGIGCSATEHVSSCAEGVIARASANRAPRPGPTDPGLLTPLEHDAVHMAGELWNLLCGITTDGLARQGDLEELRFHIHGIQRAVLKQAAARAYPELYRLLGGDPPPLPPGEWSDSETVTERRPSARPDQPPEQPRWWYLPDPVIPST